MPPPTNQAGAHAASQALSPALPLVPPASPGSAQHTLGWLLTPEAAMAAWGTGEQERGGR